MIPSLDKQTVMRTSNLDPCGLIYLDLAIMKLRHHMMKRIV